jgi:diacylglycerol kinase (ATP)
MNSDVPLLVLPLGTANVFARELGLGTSMKRIAAQIHTLQPKQIYTGKLPDRRFIMMVGGGIDSLAVAALNTDLKRKIGAAAYVIAAFNALKEMKNLKFNVTVNDQSYNCTNVIVTKGRLYGGPFTLCKEAKLEAPQLHVIMMHKSGFWALLRYGLALVLGRITSLKDVDVVSTTQVTIKSEHPLPLQVDGDLLGFTPCEISIDPNPLTVLAPPRNHV